MTDTPTVDLIGEETEKNKCNNILPFLNGMKAKMTRKPQVNINI